MRCIGCNFLLSMSNSYSTEIRFLGSIGCIANYHCLYNTLQDMKASTILAEVSLSKFLNMKDSLYWTVRYM